jgi:hypothetical protein
MDKNITLEEFLEKHELFQAALVEAVHRYYFDNCFSNKDGKLLCDENSRKIGNLYKTLSHKTPSWRYILKQKIKRYTGDYRPVTILHSDLESPVDLEVKINF